MKIVSRFLPWMIQHGLAAAFNPSAGDEQVGRTEDRAVFAGSIGD